ncbi:MAG: CRISPR-associated helicase Cas3' [Candidatus Bathyarchaeia archaeon]|nr:CRISPR-associated helicase Cas3' [Candidatus Bathyarchaeota archaeon A05DMB-3]
MFTAKDCHEWDNKNQKYSHKGKLLIDHIEEVKQIARDLLRLSNNFSDFNLELLDYLAEYHDYGKLCKKWDLIGNPPPHSPWSVQWLLENSKKFKDNDKLTYVLWYFILKHHSKLSKTVPLQEYKIFIEILRKLLPEYATEEKINLVDIFGLFKIADVLSASNKQLRLNSLPINEESVRKIIGEVDENRWIQQRSLQQIGNIGILRAYTGWGKTSASLLFFCHKNTPKIFYLLPTITAINKFHKKLSAAFPHGVSRYFYFYDAEISEDDDRLNELYFAKNFLSSIVITTIDQFLLSFMQYGKYHTKRVMFRNAGLIFDEIHLLNPLMLSLTTYFLRKYLELYKVKALFMSATLPRALSRYLMEELNVKENNFLDYSDEYYKLKRVKFVYSSNYIENSINEIAEQCKKGNKVLVIANTIPKAVAIYKKIVECMPQERIILLHSRFMHKDRREKEQEIDVKDKTPHVFISTQISEVSLDISYNLLFSEVSPLPSMIQRFGRVNRYGKNVSHTNVFLYQPEIKNELYYPYEPQEIQLAIKILKELEGDKMKSEGELLEVFDSEYSFNRFMNDMQKAQSKIDLEAFEEAFSFFFCFDINDDRLMRVLQYREAFNVLIIPHPECIINEDVRGYVERLLSQSANSKGYEIKRKFLAKIKNILVPVPIWWIRNAEIQKNSPYPIVRFEDKVYNKSTGLVEKYDL